MKIFEYFEQKRYLFHLNLFVHALLRCGLGLSEVKLGGLVFYGVMSSQVFIR